MLTNGKYLSFMSKPTVIMATSNGVGAGHLIRTAAIARELRRNVRPILFSMANSANEVADALDMDCEFVPSRDKAWMARIRWDKYLRDRLIALIDETSAKVVTFDGVVPYPGILAVKFKRPNVSLVWIRRGMWKSKPQGLALSLQAKLMDYVIEPGDLASAYDTGPTKGRNDAVLTKPVSLYKQKRMLDKYSARRLLNLSRNKTVILIQLGVGELDANEKVRQVIKILSRKRNVQIVMTREPRDKDGIRLISGPTNIKVIRYFPLVEVLNAFDGVICASGYNSVHEVIPARTPTLFIPNIRGTDDQMARAKWCADLDLALVTSGDLSDLEEQIEKLLDPAIRAKLRKNCGAIRKLSGAAEIAELVQIFMDETVNSLILKRIRYQRLLAQSAFERGIAHLMRRIVNSLLRATALIFRLIFPHELLHKTSERKDIFFGTCASCARKVKQKEIRFEQILAGSSSEYLERRIKIAKRAYQTMESEFTFQMSSGNEGSNSFNSVSKSA